MTANSATNDHAATVSLGAAIAGIRGHVVLSSSADRIAIWQVTPTGQKTGAWVYSLDETRDQAQTILTFIERRAIAGTDRNEDLTMLRRLAKAASIDLPSAYTEQWIDLREILADVVATRQRLDQLVEERGAMSAGSLQPLAYTYQIEDVALPGDAMRALAALGLALPQEGETATEIITRMALAKANILSAAVARWVDTESARLRRTYLREEGGPSARPLPPAWLSRLSAVYTAPFGF